jgi:hypothetical protein
MKKILHVLNINDFFPELFGLCFPTIQAYARRNGYAINIITERKFHDYPVIYEKVQVYEDGKGYDVNLLVDGDMLIHPQFPDVINIVPPHHVGFNDNYNISTKFHTERLDYFLRDGRDVGIATNFVVAYKSTHDIWKPLPYTPQEIEDLSVKGLNHRGWGHYADEFCLSYNLAKYGLRYTGITWEDWQRQFLVHTGTGDKEEALNIARQTLEQWSKL